MKLFHKKNDAPVIKGDLVTDFRGEAATVTGWQEPHKEGSSGRIYVHYKGDATGQVEYYPHVFGCEFR